MEYVVVFYNAQCSVVHGLAISVINFHLCALLSLQASLQQGVDMFFFVAQKVIGLWYR